MTKLVGASCLIACNKEVLVRLLQMDERGGEKWDIEC
jgi:hypothetical protein